MQNNDLQTQTTTSAGMDTKPIVSRRFAIGDEAELIDLVRGGLCLIVGTVVKVRDVGELQYVEVDGETKSGIKVKRATYTDDNSLKLLQTFG